MEAEEDESVIKDEINVFNIPYNVIVFNIKITNFSEKSPMVA